MLKNDVSTFIHPLALIFFFLGTNPNRHVVKFYLHVVVMNKSSSTMIKFEYRDEKKEKIKNFIYGASHH